MKKRWSNVGRTKITKTDLNENVVISRQYFEYLKRAESAALRGLPFKAEIYNEEGKLIALQG